MSTYAVVSVLGQLEATLTGAGVTSLCVCTLMYTTTVLELTLILI